MKLNLFEVLEKPLVNPFVTENLPVGRIATQLTHNINKKIMPVFSFYSLNFNLQKILTIQKEIHHFNRFSSMRNLIFFIGGHLGKSF